MSSRRNTIVLAVAAAAALAASGGHIYAQGPAPTNDAPNPYNTVKDFFKLPAGRVWGSTSAVDIDKDGKSIWVAERCGTNSCFDRATNTMSQLPTVLKFDQSGKLVQSFGAGMLIFPHGIWVDRDGNVWVTDGQDNAPAPARGGGAGAAGAAGAAGGAGRARCGRWCRSWSGSRTWSRDAAARERRRRPRGTRSSSSARPDRCC